ncbi:Protein transport protein sec39 like [Verticillium longisporum]|uniref:Protein transport protein sec39 like n=1 Tax=Verticillium longisporum TaxID=100787 RepID=A0A8I2ZVC4_VERLO|nr:Protein transport protein sec39 like [Verticillium longisporum]
MSLILSPPKLVLLAVHLATTADVNSLAYLTSRYPAVLRKDIILRILLTYLPETVPSAEYVNFLKELESGDFDEHEANDLNYATVHDLNDEEAAKKVRKLRLLPLSDGKGSTDADEDHITSFLYRRAYRVDEEAGLLAQLPVLLAPFLHHSHDLRTWAISTLLPLLRRNHEYYPQDPVANTLLEFQKLPDNIAIGVLLSNTGANGDLSTVGRDLPRSWRVALAAVEQYNGPEDVDLGEYDGIWLREEQQQYLDRRYARAILACAYIMPEANSEALHGAYQMVSKVMELLGNDSSTSLEQDVDNLQTVTDIDSELFSSPKNTAYMRDDLLHESNPLTSPSLKAARLLQALILSAFLFTQAGYPCSIKRAGDLAFIQDEREQKMEATKLVHTIVNRAPRNDESYWTRSRRQILWLRDWGAKSSSEGSGSGVLGRVTSSFLEAEILKGLLANNQYSLAASLYEGAEQSLSQQTLQDTILGAALNAYDNATNPNRTRGGLKKCDEIINAFPQTIGKSLPARQRIDALLKATHALSDYRLVLKQGEPFSPVVLRVHADPLSIISKVLEQNKKSYTQMQDLLEVGYNMVKAGLTTKSSHGTAVSSEVIDAHVLRAEERIVAMCIEAALREDDFETAYSYVVSRISERGGTPARITSDPDEEWPWRSALLAGQYVRTAQTIQPTHLGTASGNPEIRHLEQRIDCLSTALRIAPAAQLQEILKTFRRCEEQLDSAVKAEAALEADEDDLRGMPGGFGAPAPARRVLAVPGGRGSTAPPSKASGADEAPMSLFDLSRATARAASRNFAALSSLQQSSGGGKTHQSEGPGNGHGTEGHEDDHHRLRKRDQLREAAMGTLTSGVGWLIGAPASGGGEQRDRDD